MQRHKITASRIKLKAYQNSAIKPRFLVNKTKKNVHRRNVTVDVFIAYNRRYLNTLTGETAQCPGMV